MRGLVFSVLLGWLVVSQLVLMGCRLDAEQKKLPVSSQCPVLPWSGLSLMQSKAVESLPEVRESALSLYHLFHTSGDTRRLMLFSAALSTVAELVLYVHLAWQLVFGVLWGLFVGPTLKAAWWVAVLAVALKGLSAVIQHVGLVCVCGCIRHSVASHVTFVPVCMCACDPITCTYLCAHTFLLCA
eukprot:GDKI01024170.1.p1 GENE.GDKI01024170.1~~GDKI01024170.1.p1  ORF type:complete len:185 (+),score=22.25 GDKI01024170.1:84-638(+)